MVSFEHPKIKNRDLSLSICFLCNIVHKLSEIIPIVSSLKEEGHSIFRLQNGVPLRSPHISDVKNIPSEDRKVQKVMLHKMISTDI